MEEIKSILFQKAYYWHNLGLRNLKKSIELEAEGKKKQSKEFHEFWDKDVTRELAIMDVIIEMGMIEEYKKFKEYREQ